MKNKLFSLILLIILTPTFGQTISDYPFEVEKSGNGIQSILFIPGFASSGKVWTETKKIYEKEFTCFTLTMAGFADVKAQPHPSFENWKNRIADYIKEMNIEKQF
ncbi:alpha/beta fold hydrolase [Maribacter sp. Asnod2-G09]|uniref:alpha/beta fold hydrolase n=1 Tax=Maribacter sp. Asnod2-G09 TaxID=3160577 RepID=UPI0038631955